MKRIMKTTLLLSILIFGIGCAAARPAATAAPQAPPVVVEEYDASGGTANQRKGLPGASQNSTSDQVQTDVRMIVYTGALSLQVNDTADTVNKIQDLLKNVNGYIANKSLVAFGKDKLRGTITVRIPAPALETTIGQIKALGVKVLKETQDSNDVTAEYTDLDARRKNLEAYEVELQKLLDTVRERTGKAEDILAVYNQLTEVRGQIEQIRGRQNYLQNTSALASYTIELVPIEEVVVEGKPGWDPGRTAREALDNLVSTLQGLGDVAITFALFVLPVLVILILPVAIFVWILRAVVKRRAPKKPVAAS